MYLKKNFLKVKLLLSLQCAHGDVALYPLAKVELEIEVHAAVSDTLPVSALLGTDVPELGLLLQNKPLLLQTKPLLLQTSGMKEALVMTRAQVRENERAEAEQLHVPESTTSGREADGEASVEVAVKPTEEEDMGDSALMPGSSFSAGRRA